MRAAAALAIVALGSAASAAAAERKLPPDALRGPAHLLRQYPTPALATEAEREAARELWLDLRRSAVAWRSPARAARLGYPTRRPTRKAHNRRLLIVFHAENARLKRDDRYLDPEAPDTLIYADVPGRPLVLIGVMFSMPRGMLGPTPGGPITRWHSHVVCARGAKRGINPRPDGSCPRGMTKRLGSEMMHVWFTNDLRSAFAIHAPRPELCKARLVPASRCGSARHDHSG